MSTVNAGISPKLNFFKDFLKDILDKVDKVFILGDLFEFYHGYDGYIYPWYKGVADVLKKLTESGKSVVFLEGNHEFGMGSFFENLYRCYLWSGYDYRS